MTQPAQPARAADIDDLSYYERRDYYRTGETEPFPYGDERFGIPQRGDLEFAVLVKDLSAPGTAPAG